MISSYLHPTMYLLILITADASNKLGIFTSHYVSINSLTSMFKYEALPIFTSHYVSINSDNVAFLAESATSIYIPLCIY